MPLGALRRESLEFDRESRLEKLQRRVPASTGEDRNYGGAVSDPIFDECTITRVGSPRPNVGETSYVRPYVCVRFVRVEIENPKAVYQD